VRLVRHWLSLLFALPRVLQRRAYAFVLLLASAAVFTTAAARASQSPAPDTTSAQVLQTPRGERPTFAQPLRDPPVRADARRLRAPGARSESEHDGPHMSALAQGSRRAFVGGATGGLLKGGGAVVSNVAKKVAPKATAAVGKIRSLTSEKLFQKQYKQLGQAARKATPCNCFAAGTLVWTETGLRAIETLKVGDQVLSWSEDTGEVALKPVTATFVTPDRPLFDLAIGGVAANDVITTTPGHPFWVEGTGWVHAGELTSNDALRSLEPLGQLRLEDVPTRTLAYGAVYNLAVAEFHTYFVGANGVLVHNTSPCVGGIPDDAYVVRGGIATPEQIAWGIGPHRDVPGLTGFSAQSRGSASVSDLAATGGVGGGAFPHGKVSVTTAGKLRCIGCDVVSSPGGGANHVTVTLGNATPSQISAQFTVQPNPAR
jgi:Pretoxin HINT domain